MGTPVRSLPIMSQHRGLGPSSPPPSILPARVWPLLCSPSGGHSAPFGCSKCLGEGVLFPGRPLTEGHSYQYRHPVPEPPGPYPWPRATASGPTVPRPTRPLGPAELVAQSVPPPLLCPELRCPGRGSRAHRQSPPHRPPSAWPRDREPNRAAVTRGLLMGLGMRVTPTSQNPRDPAHSSWEQTPTRPTAWEPAVPPGCPLSSPRPPWPPHPSEVIFQLAHARWKNRPGHLAAKPGGPLGGGGAVGTQPGGNLKQEALLSGCQGSGLWGPRGAPLRERLHPGQELPRACGEPRAWSHLADGRQGCGGDAHTLTRPHSPLPYSRSQGSVWREHTQTQQPRSGWAGRPLGPMAAETKCHRPNSPSQSGARKPGLPWQAAVPPETPGSVPPALPSFQCGQHPLAYGLIPGALPLSSCGCPPCVSVFLLLSCKDANHWI